MKRQKMGGVGAWIDDIKAELAKYGEEEDPAHCPSCGGVDWFQLPDRGVWVEVCCTCGRRMVNEA